MKGHAERAAHAVAAGGDAPLALSERHTTAKGQPSKGVRDRSGGGVEGGGEGLSHPPPPTPRRPVLKAKQHQPTTPMTARVRPRNQPSGAPVGTEAEAGPRTYELGAPCAYRSAREARGAGFAPEADDEAGEGKVQRKGHGETEEHPSRASSFAGCVPATWH